MQSGPLPREAWKRIVAGTDCSGDKRTQPLLRAYPDFAAVPGAAGVRDWSMIRFDTDSSGTPINITVRTGSGNAALDRAAVEAVGKSRFTPGQRSGCHYPYWKAAPRLAAPAPPPETEKRDACGDTGKWEVKPTLVYPPEYSRRAIEGWAVVRYDIAPWGATGNVTVVSAQPSADFGEQAKAMIERAKAAPSAAGVQGCSVRVRYAMPEVDDGAPSPPPIVD
jgi:TonB family protein